MYQNHTCPRCQSPIPQDRLMGPVVICECGWSGTKAQFGSKKGNKHLKYIKYIVTAAILGLLVFDGKQWGKHYPERVFYKVKSTLKMTTARDEASMANLCRKMKKHVCAANAYTKALKKAPKSKDIAGALAIELTKVKSYDRAVLTFQNFFTTEKGELKHKFYYAEALSESGQTDMATEWYYQAIQMKADFFKGAEALINHLAKNENYVEALSVIGHYQTLYPKTQKKWADLTSDVIAKYEGYTNQYKLDEIKISGLSKYLYAPVRMSGNMETKLFMVDPNSDYLTVDLNQIQSSGIDYKDLGKTEVTATNGTTLSGNKIVLSELTIGTFTLKNVKALACANCAFLLGKDVMKKLNFKPQDANGVKYITLRQ